MKLTPIIANCTELELPNGITVLFSYQTPVAAHLPGEGYARTDRRWSNTTSKHIGQFLTRHGGSAFTTKPQAFFDALTA